ncbi:FtsX-like permease family protein [Brumimicrobium aurantiacum]|uniref:ABC transporter permease n=1 Tax=Brumimicrobium aurantiacum TaxID=1737063 RepID=A0A3E1EUV4_9FLAO|nr:FtsX-like permease family protein [Brumimicrobium aurantiacum]RFC53344.1 ABC transporter permease [Brumimicrobium aurantiacum]
MLKKILFNAQNKSQLIIAMIGAFLGFTFLVTSIHYLIRVNEFGEGEEILGSNTMIIQKKVTNLNTLKLASLDFSAKDIDHLKKQEFTKSLDPIISNNFDVTLQTDSELVPYMRTDVFVQSIKGEFTKIDSDKWKWKPGDQFVPIILPREFLVMLNTFATAKGIPPVSDDLAKSVNFKFTLSAKGKKEKVDVRIVGFTNEVSAILVPSSFMEYGNTNYAKNKAAEITQLMITVKEGLFGEYENYIKRHSIESKANSMVVGKLKSVAGTLFSILIAISVITVFLAGLVLLQYAQLLISKNEYEIKTLLHLGYSPRRIIRSILFYFIKVFALISAASLLTFSLIKLLIDQMLMTGGIQIDSEYTLLSFLAVFIAFGVYTIVNYFNAKRGVLKTL